MSFRYGIISRRVVDQVLVVMWIWAPRCSVDLLLARAYSALGGTGLPTADRLRNLVPLQRVGLASCQILSQKKSRAKSLNWIFVYQRRVPQQQICSLWSKNSPRWPDIAFVTKTWWNSMSTVNIERYTVFRCDRNNGLSGGGVCAYFRDNLVVCDVRTAGLINLVQ